ncbi:MAG: TrmB family transcriptional regulator sugar-binding domain-containing protein [Candidatus Hydrothermarchaeaceae archaeon]
MKLVDAREGKVLGVNFVDLMVLIIVGFIVFSFAGQILSKDLTFGGEEMYNAIQTFQKLDSKGFLLEADVSGNWVADDSEFHSKGLLLSTSGGAFVMKLEEGKMIRLGGSMAYLEDIAVSKVTLLPLDNHVVLLHSDPRDFSSFQEFLGYLESRKAELGADHLLLTADLSFMKPDRGTKEIHNELEKLYLVKSTPIVGGGVDESIFRVNLVELSELRGLSIESEGVTMGKATLIFGFNNPPGPLPIEGDYHVASVSELL